MEVSELRIGNWLKATFQNRESIEEVENICNGLINPFTYEGIESNMNTYEGIPLTEEWLLKFGFENYKLGDNIRDLVEFENADYKIFYHDDADLFVYNDSVNGWMVGISAATYDSSTALWQISNRIEYVHTLQNIAHSLMNVELTVKELVK